MEELELFEAASKDLFETMQGFKDNLSVQFPLLDSDNWQYDKGSIKVCKADESGFKKRCRVGISYNLKASLLNEDAEQIWLLFKDWFNTSRLAQVERNPHSDLSNTHQLPARHLSEFLSCPNQSFSSLKTSILFLQFIKITSPITSC